MLNKLMLLRRHMEREHYKFKFNQSNFIYFKSWSSTNENISNIYSYPSSMNNDLPLWPDDKDRNKSKQDKENIELGQLSIFGYIRALEEYETLVETREENVKVNVNNSTKKSTKKRKKQNTTIKKRKRS